MPEGRNDQIIHNYKTETHVHFADIMDSFVTGPHIYFIPPCFMGLE